MDLRSTPPDKVVSRLFGALERIGPDVTLLVLLRDTPEYAGVAATVYQALRARGYVSDSTRSPAGGQRLRVQRRREVGHSPRSAPAAGAAGASDAAPSAASAVSGDAVCGDAVFHQGLPADEERKMTDE